MKSSQNSLNDSFFKIRYTLKSKLNKETELKVNYKYINHFNNRYNLLLN